MSLLEVDEFLRQQKVRGNSQATHDFYEVVLNKFVEVAGVTDVRSMDQRLVEDWKLSLSIKPESVRTYERAVRAWCNWMVRAGHIDVSPFASVPKTKVPTVRDYRGLTAEDVRSLLQTADVGDYRLRNRMVLATLLDTGMRVGELASVQLSDINWAEKIVSVRGKTGSRAVPAQTCLRYMQRYIQRERKAMPRVEALVTTRTGTPMAATAITTMVRRLAIEAGVQATKLGPHTFRHTFATEYLRSGGDVFSLMRILGHSNVKTTEQYVRWLTGDVQAAHAKHSPGSRWL